MALVALAVGVLLVSPFLSDVSANLLSSRHTDEKIADYYSADAGIEWGLWRLKNDPTLSASACTDWTPLEPTPSSINGGSFPTTEICSVSDAGAAETVTPDWQGGGGPHCYPFTSTAAGSIFVVVTSELPPTCRLAWLWHRPIAKGPSGWSPSAAIRPTRWSSGTSRWATIRYW